MEKMKPIANRKWHFEWPGMSKLLEKDTQKTNQIQFWELGRVITFDMLINSPFNFILIPNTLSIIKKYYLEKNPLLKTKTDFR